MASTNIQTWNPSQINQEDDAAYSADPLRSGGIPASAIMPSPSGNKLFNQCSVMVAAIATWMVAYGADAIDSEGSATLSNNFNTAVTAIVNGLIAIALSAYTSSVVTPAIAAALSSYTSSVLNPAISAALSAYTTSTLAPAIAAITPTVTLKSGTNGGNYTTSSGSFVDVDSGNLLYTVTIPTGWKLLINSTGTLQFAGGGSGATVALFDGSTELQGVGFSVTAGGSPCFVPYALSYAINGDNASHTITLQYKSAGGFAPPVINNSTNIVPTMTFLLTPSN